MKRLIDKARSRSYNLFVSIILKEEYVSNAPRYRRPKILAPEKETEILATSKFIST